MDRSIDLAVQHTAAKTFLTLLDAACADNCFMFSKGISATIYDIKTFLFCDFGRMQLGAVQLLFRVTETFERPVWGAAKKIYAIIWEFPPKMRLLQGKRSGYSMKGRTPQH